MNRKPPLALHLEYADGDKLTLEYYDEDGKGVFLR